jgi:hypothetical protein
MACKIIQEVIMKIKKCGLSFIFVLVTFSFPCLSLQAQGQEGVKFKPGLVVSAASGGEKAPAFPVMAKPGNHVPLSDGYYFLYGFDKKPKLGMLVIKVEIFSKEGKKDTTFEVKADAGMPSMKGAHETGEKPFTISKNGDYLLPVNIVMPGGWEIRLTFIKEGKVIFRGSHQFDV